MAAKKLTVVSIDGSDTDIKDMRTRLWNISKVRTYPQVFIRDGQRFMLCVDHFYMWITFC